MAGIFGLLSVYPASRIPITQPVHEQIKAALKEREAKLKAGEVVTTFIDPLDEAKGPQRLPDSDEQVTSAPLRATVAVRAEIRWHGAMRGAD